MEPIVVKTVSKCKVSVEKLLKAFGLLIKVVFLHEDAIRISKTITKFSGRYFILSKVK